MKIPDFSVKHPVAVLMIFLAVIILGIIALIRIPVAMLPDIQPPIVSVLTVWPGAGAADVETEVTEHIEDEVGLIAGLDVLTSQSFDNVSLVTSQFRWGVNLDEVTDNVRTALDVAKGELPDDAEKSLVLKFSSADIPILGLSITGDTSWSQLHHLASEQIVDELQRVPGVGAITLYGGVQRQINICFDLHKINSYQLNLEQINHMLAAENVNIPAGSIKSGTQEYFIRLPGRFQDVDELRNIVIGQMNNRLIYLRDVATVEDGFQEQEMYAWGGEKEAIVLLLQKQRGENAIAVVTAVKEKLQAIEKNLPADVEVSVVLDGAESITASINNLQNILLLSILFITLVTLFFLRELKAAVIIVLAMPISLCCALILIYLMGYSVNIFSLMAMVIACGMLVDNSIVIQENIARHLERSNRIKTSTIFGTGEMLAPVVASTLVIVVVFVPLVLIEGIVGALFRELALVVIITLLASLFVSLSLTPVLSAWWLKTKPPATVKKNSIASKASGLVERKLISIENIYGRMLNWALAHKKTVILLAIFIFSSSFALTPFIASGFLPKTDSGDIDVAFSLPAGTKVTETALVTEELLQTIKAVVKPEEFKHSYAFCGRTEDGLGLAMGMDEGSNEGAIGFKLVDRDKRARSAQEIAHQLRTEIKQVPGIAQITITATDPFLAALVAGGKPIIIEITGADMNTNIKVAEKLQELVKKVPGTVDVTLSLAEPKPELQIKVDRDRAASFGLNNAMIAMTVRNYLHGTIVTELRDGEYSIDIRTRLSAVDRNDWAGLAKLPIVTLDGRMIKLENVATIKSGTGPVSIERKNRQRVIKVKAALHKRSLGEVAADIENLIKQLALPSGVSVSLGGEIEEQAKAFENLALLSVLGIMFVYMILAALYGNLRDPLIVMLIVPFALTGVFYVLFLTGTPLDVISFMGIVMLIGIVAKNAIVLLDYTKLLQKRGQPLSEAVINAGTNRLRPILMTTATTFSGMLPMAISQNVGAEMWNPLGITIIGGLVVSTLVTLILLPTVYYLLEEKKLQKTTYHREAH